jgi:hypothetical protein
MNDPDDIAIPMHLDTGHDTLPQKTLRMVSLDEQRLFEVHRAGIATSRVAAHGCHTGHVVCSKLRVAGVSRRPRGSVVTAGERP